MPQLTITTADGRTFQRSIDKDVLTVGRSSKNDINLKVDVSLSRLHAEITREGEDYYVHDKGSRNGTYLNGVLVAERTLLKPGDRITLGESTIRFGESVSPKVVIDDAPLGSATTTYAVSVDEIISHSNVFPSGGEARPAAPTLPGGAASPDGSAEAGRALAIMSRAGMELINHRPTDEIPDMIMDLVFEAISADRGFLILLEGEDQQMVHKAVRDKTRSAGGKISLSRSIARSVIEERQSVLTRDAQSDERFRMRQSVVLQGIRSAMCAPLYNNKEVIGLVYVDTVTALTPFSAEDLKVLTHLANIAAVKLENARLIEETFEIERFEEELKQARDIQRRLLPDGSPRIEGYQICGHADACWEVGGDYYDYVVGPGGRVGLAIGDVSGKGMPAAILMASLQAVFRTLAESEVSLSGLVSALNRQLIRSANPNKFASFFYGEVEPATGSLRYVNAGHNPPILVRSTGEVETLGACGMVLGVLAEAAFEERCVEIAPGDLLALFSDGITEWHSTEKEMYGEDRLVTVLRDHRGEDVAAIEDAVYEDLRRFAGQARQHDDATLMIVKRER